MEMTSVPPSSSLEEGQNSDTYVLGAYAKYLGSILGAWPEYGPLHRYLDVWCTHRTLHTLASDRQSVMVADCHNGTIKQRHFQASGGGHPNESLIAALRRYDDADDARIVLAEIAVDQAAQSSAKTMDALGWVYDIDPAFLYAIYLDLYDEYHQTEGIFVDKDVENNICRNQRGHNFLMFSGLLYMTTLSLPNSVGKQVPTVIILFRPRLWSTPHHGYLFDERPTMKRGPTTAALPQSSPDGTEIMGRLLASMPEDEIKVYGNFPCAYAHHIISLAAQHRSDRLRKLKRQYGSSQRPDFDVVGMKDDLLKTFAHVQELDDTNRTLLAAYPPIGAAKPHYRSQSALDLVQKTLTEAREVDEFLRSLLQTEVGLMSIKESQRSIEEAIAVRNLTKLAFVFIPLTFATSVFGMNLNEINDTGPSLWIFLVTAVTVAILTWLYWQVTGIWRRSRPKDVAISFSDGMLCIVSIIIRGETLWLIKSHIWISLLTSARLGEKDPRKMISDHLVQVGQPQYLEDPNEFPKQYNDYCRSWIRGGFWSYRARLERTLLHLGPEVIAVT